MSAVTVTYTASSLEDIAKQLDQRAQDAESARNAAVTQRAKRLEEGRKRAFEEAAAMLRATKLEVPHG